MSYKRNQRKKMNHRKREFPHLFNGDLATVASWNLSKTPHPVHGRAWFWNAKWQAKATADHKALADFFWDTTNKK